MRTKASPSAGGVLARSSDAKYVPVFAVQPLTTIEALAARSAIAEGVGEFVLRSGRVIYAAVDEKAIGGLLLCVFRLGWLGLLWRVGIRILRLGRVQGRRRRADRSFSSLYMRLDLLSRKQFHLPSGGRHLRSDGYFALEGREALHLDLDLPRAARSAKE